MVAEESLTRLVESSDANWSGELQDEFRASTDLALHTDSATVGLDDFAGRRQTEPGPLRLGRIERLEHSHRRGLVHAATGIDHIDRDTTGNDIRSDQKLPAIGHRFERIFHKIDQGGLKR